jgi:hypothetical protein
MVGYKKAGDFSVLHSFQTGSVALWKSKIGESLWRGV